MSVSVLNSGRSMRIVTLRHSDVCVKIGKCLCDRQGHPMSLHFPSCKAVKGVIDAVKFAPDSKGLIIIDEIEVDPPKPEESAKKKRKGKDKGEKTKN